MNINKCINCEHYEPFLNGCNLYQKEVYLGEGDFFLTLSSIKSISKKECEFQQIAKDIKQQINTLFEEV